MLVSWYNTYIITETMIGKPQKMTEITNFLQRMNFLHQEQGNIDEEIS